MSGKNKRLSGRWIRLDVLVAQSHKNPRINVYVHSYVFVQFDTRIKNVNRESVERDNRTCICYNKNRREFRTHATCFSAFYSTLHFTHFIKLIRVISTSILIVRVWPLNAQKRIKQWFIRAVRRTRQDKNTTRITRLVNMCPLQKTQNNDSFNFVSLFIVHAIFLLYGKLYIHVLWNILMEYSIIMQYFIELEMHVKFCD